MGKTEQLARRRRAKVIDAYVDVAREILPQHFNVTCCLNGTRVALDVLERFGIAAQPIAALVTVVNRQMDQVIRVHGPHPSDEVVRTAREAGAHMIQIAGVPLDETGYGFHLVCVAGDRLIDSAFGQFNRPQKGILAPFVIVERCGSDFLHQGVVTVEGMAGAKAVYVAEPDEREYERVEGFQRSPWNVAVAQQIVARIEEMVE